MKALYLYYTTQHKFYFIIYQSASSDLEVSTHLQSFSLHIDFLYTRVYTAVGVHQVQSSEIYPLMRLAEWCT